MAQQKVIMTFDDNSNPKIHVEGCTGPACAILTGPLEKSLGVVVKDEKKPEFFQSAKQENTVKN